MPLATLHQKLEELKLHIFEVANEQTLIETLENGLQELRLIYKNDRTLFDEETVVFLQSLNYYQDRLKHFIDIQEDMADVIDRNDYDETMDELESLRDDFENWAVGKRVKREIRTMQQNKLPLLRQAEETRQRSRRSIAVASLQRSAPKCAKGHPTRLIQNNDWFWGCKLFPKCRSTRGLSLKERAMLEGVT